jgi:hypothetical protein
MESILPDLDLYPLPLAHSAIRIDWYSFRYALHRYIMPGMDEVIETV